MVSLCEIQNFSPIGRKQVPSPREGFRVRVTCTTKSAWGLLPSNKFQTLNF